MGYSGLEHLKPPKPGKPFVDCLPTFSQIQKLNKEYPALQKAYDNFKLTYLMVIPNEKN